MNHSLIGSRIVQNFSLNVSTYSHSDSYNIFSLFFKRFPVLVFLNVNKCTSLIFVFTVVSSVYETYLYNGEMFEIQLTSKKGNGLVFCITQIIRR